MRQLRSPARAPRRRPACFAGLSLSLSLGLLGACSDDGQGGTEGEGGPALVAEPEVIFHPNQPMIVDVIVELDGPGLVEAVHDSDPGVVIASLAVEDDEQRHHLRVRGLAPDTDHDLTLTLRDAGDPEQVTEAALRFTTEHSLPGFRPSFEVELAADPAVAVDPAYRLFDFTFSILWDPAGLYMIDSAGIPRWYYEGGPPEFPGPLALWAGVELLDDGTVLAVRDGALTIIDELGEQRLRYMSFDYGLPAFHHEAHRLANGNFLTLCNSFEDVDYSSLDLGVGLTHVAGDLLVELDPAGEIVWTWDAFDHLDPLRIRAGLDDGLAYYDPETGEQGYDWTHGNGMIELVQDDLILLSMRHQDWIIAIDHQSGEVVWRLGDEGDFALLDGTWFFHQHSPQLQDDGSLLIYDNANGNPDLDLLDTSSRAVRYALDFDAMTATQLWDSRFGEAYQSGVAGDADRTPAGNVLVLDSALQPDPTVFDIGKNFSRLTELSYTGEARPIWSLTTQPGSFVYRATATQRLVGEAD